MKKTPASYFAWGLNTCLGSNSSMLVDLIPEDGLLSEFGKEEEALLGQSLERMAWSRVRGFGTVSRVHCGAHMSPEVFYVAVAHAVRTTAAAQRQENELANEAQVPNANQPPAKARPHVVMFQTVSGSPPNGAPGGVAASATTAVSGPAQPSASSGSANMTRKDVLSPHIFIVQDVDRAPARTLECLTEWLNVRMLSAPPGTSMLVASGGAVPDLLQMPAQFVVVATSTCVPRPSATTTFSTNPSEGRLPDRLMNAFLLRIPLTLPKNPPPISTAPERWARSELRQLIDNVPLVHVSSSIVRHVRDTITAVRSHVLVASGPSPRSADALYTAIRVQAALRGSRFAVPQDFTSCLLEVLAHRVIVVPIKVLPTEYTDEHPVCLARKIVASACSSLPVIR